MTQNRKRGRNPQEDEVEVEFMPLSKRINNLHINTANGRMFLENQNRNSTSIPIAEWGPGPPNNYNQLPETPPGSVQSVDWNNLPQYSPDLNENQNPHYFNINKLLFEMYVERLQRGCSDV